LLTLPHLLLLWSLLSIPATLLLLVFIPNRARAKWKVIFSFKIWLPLIGSIILFSLSQWQFNNLRNYDIAILGFNWQWSAIVTWALLFLMQFALYRKKMVEVDAFALSWFAVLLASILYELPWHFKDWQFGFLTSPKFTLSMIGFFLLLHRYRIRPTETVGLALIPLVFNYLLYFVIPGWLPRLSVFPLFLSLASSPINNDYNRDKKDRG